MKIRVNTHKSKIGNEKIVYEGESIERQIERLLTTGEKIESISPLLYTERKDGVLPETDIRTDKMLIAQNAMGQVSKSFLAKRNNYMKLHESKVNEEIAE